MRVDFVREERNHDSSINNDLAVAERAKLRGNWMAASWARLMAVMKVAWKARRKAVQKEPLKADLLVLL